MTKKVLITGASGLLGRAIFSEFDNDASWEVLGLAFSRAGDKFKKVDLTSTEEVNKVIEEFKPNVIVHSAAEKNPDVVEKKPEETKRINEQATRDICVAAGKCGAWVVYISTDYVFDGKNPPYKEDAVPNPLNKYGVSKLEGEKITMEVSSDNSIMRVPVLYGQIESLAESAITVLFEKLKDTSKQCVMNDYERRYPTHCADIAVVIRRLADKKLQDSSNIKGIYQWSAGENMTKYDMAIAMATAFNIATDHIISDKNPTSGAPRPYDCQFDKGRIDSLNIGQRTSFKDGIVDVLKPFT